MKTENWIKQDNGALLSPDGSKMLVVDTERSVNEKSGMPYTSKETYNLIYLEQNSQDKKGLNHREIWVNEYDLGLSDNAHKTLESAKKAADKSGTIVRQVKFREVLD